MDICYICFDFTSISKIIKAGVKNPNQPLFSKFELKNLMSLNDHRNKPADCLVDSSVFAWQFSSVDVKSDTQTQTQCNQDSRVYRCTFQQDVFSRRGKCLHKHD